MIHLEDNYLQDLGLNLKEARMIRRWSLRFVSASAAVAVNTLLKIEAGDPDTSIGKYKQVLGVFGFDHQLRDLASPMLDVEARIIKTAPKSKAPKYKPRGVYKNSR